jgi:hypothetical protein
MICATDFLSSTTTFQNFPGISDLLFEEKFQHFVVWRSGFMGASAGEAIHTHQIGHVLVGKCE